MKEIFSCVFFSFSKITMLKFLHSVPLLFITVWDSTLQPQMLGKCVGAFTDGTCIITGARMSGNDVLYSLKIFVTRLAVSTEWSYGIFNW